MSERNLLECWPGKTSLEDVTVWGVLPLKSLIEIQEGIGAPTEDQTEFFCNEFSSKLDHLEGVLYRYDAYFTMLKSRLAELEPTDPLLINPRAQIEAFMAKSEA